MKSAIYMSFNSVFKNEHFVLAFRSRLHKELVRLFASTMPASACPLHGEVIENPRSAEQHQLHCVSVKIIACLVLNRRACTGTVMHAISVHRTSTSRSRWTNGVQTSLDDNNAVIFLSNLLKFLDPVSTSYCHKY